MKWAIVACLILTGCGEPKEVPMVLDRPIPEAPAECRSGHPPRLKPLPRAKPGDRVEDFAAAVGRVQRSNSAQYASLVADRSVCGAYVRGLVQGVDKRS